MDVGINFFLTHRLSHLTGPRCTPCNHLDIISMNGLSEEVVFTLEVGCARFVCVRRFLFCRRYSPKENTFFVEKVFRFAHLTPLCVRTRMLSALRNCLSKRGKLLAHFFVRRKKTCLGGKGNRQGSGRQSKASFLRNEQWFSR